MFIRVKSDKRCMKNMPRSLEYASESDFCALRNGAITMRFGSAPIYAIVEGIKFAPAEEPTVIIRGVKRRVIAII